MTRLLALVVVVVVVLGCCFCGVVDAHHERWPLAGGLASTSGRVVEEGSGGARQAILVRFDEEFPSAPEIDITQVIFNGHDAMFELFPTLPVIEPAYFLIELISVVDLEGAIEIDWAASYHGPCYHHSHCPTSQYCDVYRGCDDCSVCGALGDTFDGEACPSKCILNNSPVSTTAAATTTANTMGSGGNDMSGSGDFQDPTTPTPTSTTTMAAVFPEPCRECVLEEFPCGEDCLEVNGLTLPSCYIAEGCSVSFGRGSLSEFAQPLSAYNRSEIAAIKGAAALERLATIDPHLAGPQLRDMIAQVEAVALCASVVCPEETDCLFASVCMDGECPEREPKVQGLMCDDGMEATDEDMCDGNGLCVGTDYCADVTCTPLSQCHEAGQCSHGECSNPPLAQGTPCDDGDDITTSDMCNGLGECMGVDLCEGVVCDPPTQCHQEGTCYHGVCTDVLKPLGSSCDDGNEATDEDACDATGMCVGIDYCAGVSCEPLSQCHSAGTCSHGVCTNPPKPGGTLCDDGILGTDFDVCDGQGNCGGIDLCNGVECEDVTCKAPGTCFRGTCSYDNLPANTTCDDGEEATDFDVCDGMGGCAGVDLCDGVQCEELKCKFPGTCYRGVCSYTNYDDGTQCDDDNPSTDFDQCVSGTCVGTLQSTVGPTQGMGFVTVAKFNVTHNSYNSAVGTNQEVEFEQSLTRAIAALIPGIYMDDVAVVAHQVIPEGTHHTLTVEINTRVFAEQYVVAQYESILTVDMLGASLGMLLGTTITDITIVSYPEAMLVCPMMMIMGEEDGCPSLDCAEDEVMYQSQYVSVRTCCPICIKRSEYVPREQDAYEIAVGHYLEAQQQQNNDYNTIDLAMYADDLEQWRASFQQYILDLGLWTGDYLSLTEAQQLYTDLFGQ